MSNNNDPELNRDDLTQYNVVIVGAGISGLICARELLRASSNVLVTVVEASDHIGGRIRGRRCHGVVIDVGAEFIHGSETILTDLIEYLFEKSTNQSLAETDANQSTPTSGKNHSTSELYEPIFTLSHADGGPDTEPTVHGKYGMYYIDGELRPFDDPAALELRRALDDLFHPSKSHDVTQENIGMYNRSLYEENQSIGESLDRVALSRTARKLALSSYGNTAASTDLYSISLPIMKQFENHWFKHETSGDFRFNRDSMITMSSVLDKLILKFEDYGPRCKFLLNWKVRRVRQRDRTNLNGMTSEKDVAVVSDDDETLYADAVVVTVSPPMLQELDMGLSPKKVQALSFIGFPRVMKVILIFSSPEPPWPKQVSAVICADRLPIPEIWFTEKNAAESDTDSDHAQSESKPTDGNANVLYLAVGYLTSQIADDFISRVNSETLSSGKGECRDLQNATFSLASLVLPQAAAARIFIHQLSKVLSVSEESLKSSCMDCILHDWKLDEPTVQGGYMYGKKGMTTKHLYDLAESQNHIFFAGEATNTNACCTVQAAMETGIRAAKEILQHFST